MSQNDFNIANQGFPATRADINSALQALVSNSAGDTEPATTYAYQLWYDSTADILKMRNADNDAWIIIAKIDQTTDAITDLVRATGVNASALIPSGTTGERDGTPSAGLMRFNSTEGFFEGYDGTEWGEIGGVVTSGTSAPTVPTPVTGDLWVDTTTAGKPRLKMYDGTAWQLVYGKDAFSISSSGYVGLGTDAPASQLVVGGNTPTAGTISAIAATGGVALALSDNVNSSLYVRNLTGGALIGTDAGGDLRFSSGGNTAAEERMRFTGGGNILLKTTSVFDSVSFLTTQIAGGVAIKQPGSAAASQMSFFNDNGRVGFILTNGTSTSYSTSSDYRLKTDVQPMAGASARVQALKPVNFEWIADGTRVDGFLAHELQDVVPVAATGTKDAVDADGNPDYQGIDHSKLVPLLTAALQEALTKIDDMEARLAKLEAKR